MFSCSSPPSAHERPARRDVSPRRPGALHTKTVRSMKLPARHRIDQLLRIWLPLAVEEFLDRNALNKQPFCITITRSAISSTTRRSCVIRRMAIPRFSRSDRKQSRICFCRQTSTADKRLIRDQEFRLQQQRASDHDTLRLASAQISRAALQQGFVEPDIRKHGPDKRGSLA